MKIKIYTISKKQIHYNEFIEQIKQFGVELTMINIFNTNIQKAHKNSSSAAKIAYGKECEKYIKNQSYNLALDINGDSLNTNNFTKLLIDKNEVNFFIGGAYGFEESFLQKMKTISLSKLTLSHKIANIILCEQIFRAMCIINNHPYHK